MSVAGRHKTERHKGCSEKKTTKGQHQCPICKEYGHHWPSCRKGSKEDIEAMKTLRYLHRFYLYARFILIISDYLLSVCFCRGTPVKKKKVIKSAQSSIVPLQDEPPPRSMTFPPRLVIFHFLYSNCNFPVSHPTTFYITIVKTWNLNPQLKKRERALTPLLDHQEGN